MNIMIVPSWYISDSNKTRGYFFKEQAIALEKSGHHICIVYVYMRSAKELLTKDLYKITEKKEKNITTYSYSIPSFGSMHRGKWFEKNVNAYRKLLKYVLKKERIDIIHAHSYAPAGYAMVALKKEFHIPVVITEHSSAVLSEALEDSRKEILKMVMQGSDAIIAVSGALKKAMGHISDQDVDNIYVVPNIVSPIFKPSASPKTNDDIFKIISVGGLIPRKRFNILIRAFHDLFQKNDRVSLDIVGDGKERSILQKLISDYGEDARIRLVGRKGREEVANMMRNADLFVLPSGCETFGVVYIEAMASGLPVIGTYNGGFEDIYKKEYGTIVAVDDFEALKQAIREMYLNISRYNPTEISKHAIQIYGESAVVQQLNTIYTKVFKERV